MRTPDQERQRAKEKIKLVLYFFLFLGMAAPVAQRCTSAPAAPSRAPLSRALSYQDESGAWIEDTAGVTLPALKHRVQPGVPARSEQVSGAVEMKALVSRTGAVDEVVVTKSLSRAMDQEAVTAVRQWAYSPATRDGEPVAIWMTVTITFHFTG